MSAGINDGGPAYPSMRDMRHDPAFDHEPGMSLRDRIAIQAMHALITGRTWSHIGDDNPTQLMEAWATGAYQLADIMLAAREVKR